MADTSIWEKLQKIDNRVFYWILFIGLMVPFVRPLALPVVITEQTQTLYDGLLEVQPGEVVVINIAAGVGSWPEVLSPLVASVKLLVEQDVKVVGWSTNIDGQVTWEEVVKSVPGFQDYVYGEDYAYLGYYAGEETGVAQLGSDIRSVFTTDYEGTPIDQVAIMDNVNNAEDVAAVISVDAGDSGVYYVRHWKSNYGTPVGEICTGILGSNVYPFWKSGDMFGLVISVRGGAEMEKLIDEPGSATIKMDAINVSHLMVVVAVLLANIGYFVTRRNA